jgi:hypothetical protein
MTELGTNIMESLDMMRHGIEGKSKTEKFAQGSRSIRFKSLWFALKIGLIALFYGGIAYLIFG